MRWRFDLVMYAAAIEFKILSELDSDLVRLEGVIHSYMSSLIANGQIHTENYVLSYSDKKFTCHIYLARPNSLTLKYHSKDGKKFRSRIKDLSGCVPELEILIKQYPKRFRSWKSNTSLYLTGHWLNQDSPLRCGDSFSPVPLYLVPVSDQIRFEIMKWVFLSHRLNLVGFSQNDLSLASYKEYSDPNSSLNRQGLRFSRIIEEQTGIRTYLSLERYWEIRKLSLQQTCPLCGGDWVVKIEKRMQENPGSPRHLFGYCCDKCRLTSHLALTKKDLLLLSNSTKDK